jgi:small subunit ribosomal protein S6
MKNYEILCVLPGTLAETEVEEVSKRVFSVLEENGAKNVQVEDMGKSRLAYPMKHIRYGYFRLFRFEVETDVVKKIEDKLRLFPELLRAITHAYDPSKVSDKKINYVAGGTISSISREKPSSRDSRDTRSYRKREERVEKKEEVTKEVSKVEEKIEEPKEVEKSEKKVAPKVESVVVEEPTKEKKEVKATVKKQVKKEVKKSEKKEELDLDDINRKLDNILSDDIADV